MTISHSPTGHDLACIVCGKPGPGLDIDHVVNRGSGGSKERDVPENKVPLCRPCHLAKTVGTIKTRVKDGVYSWHRRESDLVFRIPVQVSKRYKCLIPCEGDEQLTAGRLRGFDPASSSLSQAGEGADFQPGVSNHALVEQTPSPVGPGLIPDGPGPLMDGERIASASSVVVLPLSPSSHMDAEAASEGGMSLLSDAESQPREGQPLPRPASASSLCQEGMQLLYWGLRIKGATDDWRYAVGDLILRMEEVYNESAYQFLEPLKDAFGYDALRQYRMVAAGVTQDTRELAPTWSHARIVATLDESDQRAALITARDEHLTSRETAILVRPEPAERERHTCSCGNVHWLEVKGEWRA